MISILNITKWNNSIKTVSGVIALNLCILYDDALYLNPRFVKISQQVSELLSKHNCIQKFTKRHNSDLFSRQDLQTAIYKGA